ncbi:hypothetical protein FB45DRAFT_436749 [Roridomyces roridus]|uniref:Uncharacterized protein n=1 Tax=Roridomyces roridus TaxID=1738132 RepID=A0AAD7F7F3_9AGAR|nr:hypothetical protein FB45DRAFT_436749 [Roridomyces roridus]
MSKTQDERDKQIYLICINDGSFASNTAESLEKMEQIALKAHAYPDHLDIKPTLDLTMSFARTFRKWDHLDRALKRSEDVQDELKELSADMDAFVAKLRMVYYARNDSRSRVLCQLRLYTPFMALVVAFGGFCSYLLEHAVRTVFVFILVFLSLGFVCEFPTLDPFIRHLIRSAKSSPSLTRPSPTTVLHDSVVLLVSGGCDSQGLEARQFELESASVQVVGGGSGCRDAQSGWEWWEEGYRARARI